MTECKHELPVEQCFDCKPKAPKQTFTAKYETVCGFHLCNRVIDVGELVVWNDEGTKVQHLNH
jgi:hypothetical protein